MSSPIESAELLEFSQDVGFFLGIVGQSLRCQGLGMASMAVMMLEPLPWLLKMTIEIQINFTIKQLLNMVMSHVFSVFTRALFKLLSPLRISVRNPSGFCKQLRFVDLPLFKVVRFHSFLYLYLYWLVVKPPL